MQFEEALKIILKFEGGYVNNPKDPGGETNYGITKNVAITNGYSGDMKLIPMDIVVLIYRKDYWKAACCDQLAGNLALVHFDAAVNCGKTQAGKFLQQSLNALLDEPNQLIVDGAVGTKTLWAYARLIPQKQDNLAHIYNALRIIFYIELNKPVFIHGWLNRVIALNDSINNKQAKVV